MLDAVVSNAGLGGVFHSVLSVHTLRIFKPHPSVYQWGVEALGVPKEHIAFVSSNFWDICGATSFGFRTFWINRSGAPPDELGYSPAAVLGKLDELGASTRLVGFLQYVERLRLRGVGRSGRDTAC